MSDLVIQVEELSKRYRIGQRERYKALRDTLAEAMAAPLRKVASFVRGHQSLTRTSQENNFIWALKDVSFEVKRGEVIGVIGRNGAGKTTLLKILSRITEPTEGYAKITGRVGSLLEVGTGFHPELTGRENIYLNGAILGMKKREIDRKFDEIVAFAEVERFIDTPLKHYSSGMSVRLAFSVAAHLEPEILLVDEVLAVGDAAFQKKCLGKMSGIATEGRAVLFVSHNMRAITALCQRAIWIHQGCIVQDGTCEHSVSTYLASFQEQQRTAQARILLEQHHGRLKQMDALVRIGACQLLDAHRRPTLQLTSGHSIRILLWYTMQAQLTGGAVTFVCAFRNKLGQRVAYCSSDIAGYDFSKLQPTGIVECTIPRLPLSPGTYTLDIGCRLSNGWTDFIYQACEFEVMDGGFYATRLLPPEGSGDWLLEYTWGVIT